VSHSCCRENEPSIRAENIGFVRDYGDNLIRTRTEEEGKEKSTRARARAYDESAIGERMGEGENMLSWTRLKDHGCTRTTRIGIMLIKRFSRDKRINGTNTHSTLDKMQHEKRNMRAIEMTTFMYLVSLTVHHRTDRTDKSRDRSNGNLKGKQI